MENAIVQNSNDSAPSRYDYTTFQLPTRTNTVTAHVLADFLESQALTGMAGVFKQSTTRLSAVIHYLAKNYGFEAERRDMATGTEDGRTTTIASYWLSQEVIAFAFDALGAREWIDRVRVARGERRKKSKQCKEQAAKANAKKYPLSDPRQGDLWCAE